VLDKLSQRFSRLGRLLAAGDQERSDGGRDSYLLGFEGANPPAQSRAGHTRAPHCTFRRASSITSSPQDLQSAQQSSTIKIRTQLRAFELPRKAEEGRPCAEARRKLHPEGEHLFVPVRRNGHRRLAGHGEYGNMRSLIPPDSRNYPGDQ